MKIHSRTILFVFVCPHFEAARARPLGTFNFLCLRDEICHDKRFKKNIQDRTLTVLQVVPMNCVHLCVRSDPLVTQDIRTSLLRMGQLIGNLRNGKTNKPKHKNCWSTRIKFYSNFLHYFQTKRMLWLCKFFLSQNLLLLSSVVLFNGHFKCTTYQQPKSILGIKRDLTIKAVSLTS